MSATSPPPSMSDQQLSNVLEDIEDCLKAQGDSPRASHPGGPLCLASRVL